MLAALLFATPTLQPSVRAQADLDSLIREVHQSGCRSNLAALTSLAAGTDLEAQRASFLRAWCLAHTGRYSDAAAAYAAAVAHPTLRSHARIGEGAALLRAGRTEQAAALLRDAAASADGDLKARALVALGESELALQRPAPAAAALAAATDLRPADPAIWLLLGRAAEAAGQRGRARHIYARAAWAFPGDPAAGPAREGLSRLLGRPVVPADIDPESRVLRGARLSKQGEWDQATIEFRAVTAAVRSGPTAGEAWYRLGEIYLYSDTRGAHDAFRRAAALGWNPAGAWYWTASAARRLGLAAQAREATAVLMRVAPTSFWVARYWLNVGLHAESDGRIADAAAAYRRASEAAPSSDEAVEARWRLGWIALRAGRPADAEARFRAAAAAAIWSSDGARAWYWVAKTIEARTGRPGEGEAAGILRMIAARYPLTFYGQRARARVGLPAPMLPSSPPHSPLRDVAVPAYEELARLGLDADAADAAEDELGGTRSPGIVRFLAETYGRLGDVGQSVAYAEEALAAGQRDEATWKLAYPRAYWPEVTAAAQAANIDPLFLLSLVREESRYDASVISPARAVGLAQLLPSTAQAMTSDASIGMQRLKDPALNLRLGARYIRLQMNRFGGDLRLALAAYNAGPGTARRWVALDSDPDFFVERIGFAETRAYIRRVLGSYGVYKLLW